MAPMGRTHPALSHKRRSSDWSDIAAFSTDMEKFDGGFALDGAPLNVVSRKRRWTPPERHQWFDAWKIARGDNLKMLVESTVAFVHHEQHTKARVRARRAVDETHHVRPI